jgi:chromosome segregation protein
MAVTEEQLARDLTAAMKSRDAERVAVLRSVIAAAKLLKVERRVAQLDDRVRERWKVELASWTPPVPGDVVAVSQPFTEDAEEGAESADGEDAESIVLRSSDTEWLERPRDDRERHAAELRKRVEHFGDVHMGAIEEHEEINERMRFLDEQKNDLVAIVGRDAAHWEYPDSSINPHRSSASQRGPPPRNRRRQMRCQSPPRA